MAVLNIHALPSRRIPPDAVYIGRANPRLGLPRSPFANPFPIEGAGPQARAASIEKYRKWLWGKIRRQEITIEDLVALKGKHLVCYCAPMACHGNVLEKAVAWALEQQAQHQATLAVASAPAPAPAAIATPARPVGAPGLGRPRRAR